MPDKTYGTVSLGLVDNSIIGNQCNYPEATRSTWEFTSSDALSRRPPSIWEFLWFIAQEGMHAWQLIAQLCYLHELLDMNCSSSITHHDLSCSCRHIWTFDVYRFLSSALRVFPPINSLSLSLSLSHLPRPRKRRVDTDTYEDSPVPEGTTSMLEARITG